MKNIQIMFKKYINRLKFEFLKFRNNVYVILNKKKFTKSIALVSCEKWAYTVKDDLMLKIALNKLNMNVDIVAWEHNCLTNHQYDLIVIRSIWGYQNNLDNFYLWLDNLEKSKALICNDIEIIKNNLNKYQQFKILNANKIPCIKTFFIFETDIINNISETIENKILENFEQSDEIVLKPIVSGSGNNTYILKRDKQHLTKNVIGLNEIDTKFKSIIGNKNNGLMIQKFINEINNGEYSLIYINQVLSHVVLRYPAIFSSYSKILNIGIDEVDIKIIDLAEKVIKIKEYEKALYLRVDIVKTKGQCLVMEVELVDPDLFYAYIIDKSAKTEAINKFAQNIIKKIKKDEN